MIHFELLDIALIGGVPVLILLAVFLGMKLSPRVRALPPLGPEALLLISLIPLSVLLASVIVWQGDGQRSLAFPLAYVSFLPAASALRRAKALPNSARRTVLRFAAAGVQLAMAAIWVWLLTESTVRLWSLRPTATYYLIFAAALAVAGILGVANWFERKPKPSNTPPKAMEPTA